MDFDLGKSSMLDRSMLSTTTPRLDSQGLPISLNFEKAQRDEV